MKPIWRFTTYAAVLGGVLPIVIYATSFVPVISDAWMWHNAILYVWPTFVVMIGFSGPFTAMTLIALVLSAILNSLIYALVGFIAYQGWYVAFKTRGPFGTDDRES